jgi:hypothetical protein
MTEFKTHKVVLKNGEVFEVNGTETGHVHVAYYFDGGGGSLTLDPAETQDLSEALLTALEEAQAALPEGPAFEFDEYLRVVSMYAEDAKRFMERDDEPEDLGPADASRYRAGARVWGFKGKR